MFFKNGAYNMFTFYMHLYIRKNTKNLVKSRTIFSHILIGTLVLYLNNYCRSIFKK